jgi:hypothetical protein
MDGLLDCGEWCARYSGERWHEVLRCGLEEEAWKERIREATRRGAPLGSQEFIERLSRAVGRDLTPRPPGRPRKQPQTSMVSAQTG